MTNLLSTMSSRSRQKAARSSNPHAPGYAQRLYSPLGFSKGYNAVLCKLVSPIVSTCGLINDSIGFIFAGAIFGFSLARLMYLSIDGVFCGPKPGINHATPGECYYYQNFSQYAVGIRLHLFTILRKD